LFVVGGERRVVFWHLQVSETLNRAVEEAVDKDMHSTKTELIREAVREKLSNMGFTPAVVRDLK